MGINTKPFLTYNTQMKHLRDDKKIGCSGSTDKTTLIRLGYFNLINGYKDPFILKTDNEGNHTYIGGTTIEHFKSVKEFDDNIRNLLMSTLTKIEEEVRTLTGYKFDFVNEKAKTEWYDVESYNPQFDTQDKIKIISKCFREIEISHQPYVTHYLEKHKALPTWVFIKVINFSSFIEFISLTKSEVINSICNLYQIYDDYGNPNPNLLVSMLHWMRKLRNSCAHNERVYGICRENARVKIPFKRFINHPKPYLNQRNQRLMDGILYLRYFLNDKEYAEFIEKFKSHIFVLKQQLNQNAFEKVRATTGIRNLDILDELSSTKKSIKYIDF